MGTKRKYEDLQTSKSKPWSGSIDSRSDPQYGQRYAIPGLDSDNEEYDEFSIEALQYLRSVRAQAQAIPSVIQAQGYQSYENDVRNDDGLNEIRAYYAEGAFVAISDVDSDDNYSTNIHGERQGDLEDSNDSEPDERSPTPWITAQDAYHYILVGRFHSKRSLYASPTRPPSQALASLDPKTQPTFVNRQAPAAIESAKWSYILQNSKPTPAQLSVMPQDTMLWLLERIPSMIKRNKWIVDGGRSGQNMGLWIWCLLLGMAELGTLNSEEVAIIRELGKRAAGIVDGLDRKHSQGRVDEAKEDERWPIDSTQKFAHERQPAASEAQNDIDHVQLNKTAIECLHQEENGKPAEEIDAAKIRLLSEIGSKYSKTDAHTVEDLVRNPLSEPINHSLGKEQVMIATLDMILTIVGECYGQRDLLPARDRLWN